MSLSAFMQYVLRATHAMKSVSCIATSGIEECLINQGSYVQMKSTKLLYTISLVLDNIMRTSKIMNPKKQQQQQGNTTAKTWLCNTMDNFIPSIN